MKSFLYLVLLCLTAPALAVIWSEPVLLVELNDPTTGNKANDPYLSNDGLTIYFCRNGNDGNSRILKATRSSLSDPFSSVVEISELYVGKRLYSPWVSADGLRMYYARHEGESTKTILRMAQRNTVNDPWQDVMAFTAIHQNLQYNAYESLMPDELTVYYSTPSPSAYNIWKATRSSIGDQFTNPVAVSELNDGTVSYTPHIMPDGLAIFYASIRDGYTTADLYMATRASLSDPFGNIERLNINSNLEMDSYPYVTPDMSALYFTTPAGVCVSYAVPEPLTIALMATGGLFLRRKR